MSAGPEEELREALEHLEALVRRGRPPSRYEARAVLVPLGELARSEGHGAARPWAERMESAVEPSREAWEAAAREELSLACAEYARSVDPRFLDLPNYDLAYTRGARDRLECRLVAAALLDLEVPEALDRAVREADRLLAPRLDPAARPRGSNRDASGGEG